MTEHDGHEARRLRTRQQLMEAAIGQFNTKGYANTSIADIADAAGIGRRTFYLHFPDKETLLEEMSRQHVIEIVEAVRAAGEHLTFREKLATAFREIFNWMQCNTPLCRIMVSGDNELNDRMNDNMRLAFLTEMQQHAQMRPDSSLDMPFLATAIAGIVNEVMRVWVKSPNPAEAERFTEQMITLLYERLDDHLTKLD